MYEIENGSFVFINRMLLEAFTSLLVVFYPLPTPGLLPPNSDFFYLPPSPLEETLCYLTEIQSL